MDVDGDGNLDIVTANRGASNVSILRNTGAGTFATRVNIEANCNGETSCAAADANGDGILDLFVGAYNSSELAVMLGDGNGSFTFSSKVSASSQPWMIAVGDVNGDGKVDVVSANSGNATAAVALGNGSGGLSVPVTYSTGGFPLAIDLGDIDGDGDLDLVTSNFGGHNWTVYENNGSGVFVNPRTLQSSSAGSCATLYDYDNDGDVDMTGIDELDDLIFVFRNGTSVAVDDAEGVPGAFELRQNYPNPFNPSTRINYQLPGESRVTLKVFDVLGREVAILVDGVEDGGYKSVQWGASSLASGVYVYRLQAGGFVRVMKLVILR